MKLHHSDSKSSVIASLKILATAMIWASTFILARVGVRAMGPLTLAGLRFFLAGLVLIVYLRIQHFDFSALQGQWGNLLLLGLASFTIGNGTIFYSSQYLPSTTVSLMMNFITPLVLLCSILFLKEIPQLIQFLGLGVALGGSLVYFSPQQLPLGNPGFLALIVGLFGFTAYTILGRAMARDLKVHFLAQTAFPLTFGGGILLCIGFLVEGWPTFTLEIGAILVWLILVNTILGYILYNQAIGQLTALKTNMILNLSPFFTALLAWFLLEERISPRQIAAMLVIFIGTFLVQTDPGKLRDNQAKTSSGFK